MAATAPTVSWVENPATENFNPGDPSGQKMFQQLSKGPADDKRFGLTIKDSGEFITFLHAKAHALGTCVTRIEASWDAAGAPLTFVNLIDQYPTIDLSVMQRAAHKRYGHELAVADPIPPQPWSARVLNPAANDADRTIFYSRVRSAVVLELLNNSLDLATLETLQMDKEMYTFTDVNGIEKEDGPTKLWCYLKRLDPSTNVNIETHRRIIENARLHQYKNNVATMINDLSKHHKIITDNRGAYENSTFLRHCFDALQSGPNADFNNQIKAIKKDVDSGIGYHAKILPRELLTASLTYYNNLKANDQWDKVDPQTAQIMALQTELKELKEASAKQVHATAAPKPSGNAQKNSNGTGWAVEKWRVEYKGPTIERDGVTHHWCKHHKIEGKYDGMYFTNHTEATHSDWQDKRDRTKKRKQNRNGGNPATTTTAPASKTDESKKMEVSNKLRSALATNLCVSEEDINKIINEYQEN